MGADGPAVPKHTPEKDGVGLGRALHLSFQDKRRIRNV